MDEHRHVFYASVAAAASSPPAGEGAGARCHHVTSSAPYASAGSSGRSLQPVLTRPIRLSRAAYLLSLSTRSAGAVSSPSTSFPRTIRVRRDRRLPVAPGARLVGKGSAGRYDAAWHGHHPGGQRPVVLGDRGVLDRAVGLRHGRVREPARRDLRGAWRQPRDQGHSQLPGLRDSSSSCAPELLKLFSGGNPNAKIVRSVELQPGAHDAGWRSSINPAGAPARSARRRRSDWQRRTRRAELGISA